MSRIAKYPVEVPSGVEVTQDGQEVTVKGPNGELRHQVHALIGIDNDGEAISFTARNKRQETIALAGTTRAVINNMVTGVSQGFERRLHLQGVGYRAQMEGTKLSLTLGFSHPVEYEPPEGVTVETPTNTEVVIKGIDKQLVGQTAAKIRGFRPPEPYKGKGVRYAEERVVLKEAKKK
jgi:large subunit ribosomal protein L6